MRYHDLSITDFRSIKSLRFEDFKRINLITGKNNSGKTSMLEALFLLSGMSNPRLPLFVNNWRNLVLTSDDDFSFLFRGLDFAAEPCIAGDLDGKMRQLSIRPRRGALGAGKKLIGTSTENGAAKSVLVNSSAMDPIEGLVLEFQESKGSPLHRVEVSLKEELSKLDKDYNEPLRCSFYNSSLAISALTSNFESLLVNKEVASLVEVLKEVDPRISDLRMSGGGMVYADIGLPKMIPLNLMGDGVNRILAMAAVATRTKGGVILLDEIENGLHYSALGTLWKALIRIAVLNDVQIFATTHSYECIESLASCLGEEEARKDEFRMYRLDVRDGLHQVTSYPTELIKSAMDEKYEVR